MDVSSLVGSPGKIARTMRTPEGETLAVPVGWELLPPGDAVLTRRVKAAGPAWTMQEKRGRKVFSRGVWAPGETIARVQAELEAERGTEAYARQKAAGQRRRERVQTEYAGEFEAAIVAYLAFAPLHADLACRLAEVVAKHAVPVGSGTVARTKQLTMPEKAKLAVLAWMRHQTTDYERRSIARVKGRRRQVRHELAQTSLTLLARYRRGEDAPADCPLQAALSVTKQG